MSNSKSDIEQAEIGWSDGLVMVCNRCCDGESAERIKSELKAKSKEELGKKVRVITTSCLGICPENKIAIVKASKNSSETFEGYSVSADSTVDELFNKILK